MVIGEASVELSIGLLLGKFKSNTDILSNQLSSAKVTRGVLRDMIPKVLPANLGIFINHKVRPYKPIYRIITDYDNKINLLKNSIISRKIIHGFNDFGTGFRSGYSKFGIKKAIDDE